MRSIIRQSVVLSAEAASLYQMYIEPAKHEAITGLTVTIDEKEGAEFRAFEGQLSGTVLVTVRPRLIVQSWRSVAFKDDDPDSTLILTFTAEENAGRIDLIHLDVPDHDYDGVTEGWDKYYWTPWRRYLQNQ